MMIELLTTDPHVHAGPSTKPRFGSDLDLVDSAEERGIKSFVLKSHHESTASRAYIANEYARRRGAQVRVHGSIVLNPWTHYTDVERAVTLGVHTIWWPTIDSNGCVKDLELPAIHSEALNLVEGTHVRVATGHLRRGAAVQLVKGATDRGIPVAVTHPLNPNIGNGVEAARDIARLGAIVEVDALSIHLLQSIGTDPSIPLAELLEGGTRAYLCSDGGQTENGDPFAFISATFGALDPSLAAALGECARESVRWVNGGAK